jgi:HEPN domain-containing protein
MADSRDCRHWVAKAEEDVAVVHVLAGQDKRGFGLSILFHCQQAAEKHLKACLTRQRIDFPKTHDFEALLDLCASISPEFSNLGDVAARLQPFAVQARYALQDAAESTIDHAIADMETIRTFCLRLSQDDQTGNPQGR